MSEADMRDCIIEYYEEQLGKHPCEGMTKEEVEELLRQLNDDFEEDYRWSESSQKMV